MANFKKRRNKKARSGCLLCKPHKMNGIKTAERLRDNRQALQFEELANEGINPIIEWDALAITDIIYGNVYTYDNVEDFLDNL